MQGIPVGIAPLSQWPPSSRCFSCHAVSNTSPRPKKANIARSPDELLYRLAAAAPEVERVVIDEIQRVPRLPDMELYALGVMGVFSHDPLLMSDEARKQAGVSAKTGTIAERNSSAGGGHSVD